jgi:protein-S-isoprenylcysteine O-methyltransferase Ste14
MDFEDAPKLVKVGRWLFRHRSLKSLFLLPVFFWFWELECPAATWSVGILLLLLGGGLRLWSISFIGRSARTRGDKVKKLITSGPFALCRNPIYLGNIIATCGFVVFSEVVWYVPVYLALSFAFYSFVVLYEEYLIAGKYPDQYPAYKAKTPRWFPRPNKQIFVKPLHGISEILYREKSFFRVVEAGLLLALAKEVLPI